MMKNRKMILVFALVIALLSIMVSYVQATDDSPLQIINGQNQQQTNGNNEENTATNNEEATLPVINNEETGNNTTNTTSNESLPQTGVAENTALFVFIAICIVSTIYAYIKIRNYKNL